MYKKILQSFKLSKNTFLTNLYKSEGNHAIKDRKPHFIFSAENPMYPTKLKMDHSKVLNFLQDRGYKAEELQGKYGNEEKSILVHNPPKHAIKHFFKLAHNLGQESSIYSDGYNHELHYHHGDNAGKHHKGQGTDFHKKPPQDYYSKLGDGTTFTHNFKFDELHDHDKSMIKESQEKIKKSEGKERLFLSKNEGNEHPLKNARPDLKLIHYSPHEGIKEIDPHYHGIRGTSPDAKHGKPKHPMAFYYLEGTEPEEVVTSGAKHKYVASKGGMKFYDVGKDEEGLRSKAKELAESENKKSKYPNPPGTIVPQREHLDKVIRDSGYHGMYNSSLNNTMRNVVGVYDKVAPEASYKIHPNDYKVASSEDHHTNESSLNHAKEFAKQNQHHNGEMLHNLKRAFKNG